MTKLNQIVAIEKDVKTKASNELTAAYQQLKKTPALTGISRTYRPKDEDGDRLPSESTQVQLRAEDVIKDVTESLIRLFDVTATKDFSNTTATGTVKVGSEVLVKDAPVPFLLFLEKQVTDLRTFVRALPTLDPAEEWELSPEADAWATKPVETIRQKKLPKAFIRYEATEKHPAQVETFQEDVLVGYWSTIHFSGAVPQARITELLTRVERLLEAIKFAREDANSTAVTDTKVGAAILGYVFA